jgi:hypothetical protein
MRDEIYLGFLESAEREAPRLVAQSGILSLAPAPGVPRPPDAYLGVLRGVEHFERDVAGGIQLSAGPIPFELSFPPDYCRSVDPTLQLRIAQVGVPLVHPNSHAESGRLCLGPEFAPGSSLRSVVIRLYLICSGRAFASLDPLDAAAARFFDDRLEQVRALRAEPLFERALARSVRIEERAAAAAPVQG